MPLPTSAITGTLPATLFRVAGSANPFVDELNTYDYAIGSVPFRADASPENPLIRSSAQFRKDQFDNGLEPGEQTLSGWWLRSQSSWHLGAGIVNSDVRLDETAEFRFADSEGVTPWTRGQISLLHSMDNIAEGGASTLAVGVVGSTEGVLYANDGHLYFVDDSAATEITWGGSGTILSITSDGTNWYAGSAGGIYWGALSGTSGTKLWTVSATRVLIRWCKGRLVAAVDAKIYELVTAGSPPLTLPATPIYTHPVSTFIWAGISEGPEAIYAIGHSGADSFLLKMALNTAGALPTLTLATSAAELPRGELGTALYTYVGRWLCIGTSRGVRIAEIQPGGDLSYGPLVETAEAISDFVAQDHFIYAGLSNGMSDGTSGAMRLDLAELTGTGRYPYARDVMVHQSGAVLGVTTFGRSGRLVLAVAGHGLYLESTTDFESSGYFTTGRIRHNTLWPKLFKRFRIKATLDGPIAVASVDDAGNTTLLASISAGIQQNEDLPINVPSTPQEFIQLRFTLTPPAGDATLTPTLRGYQVKSLPGGPRPRRYVLPLRCYDSEQDLNGVASGYPGFGLERLQAMEALDSAGEVVLFEDLAAGTAEAVTIEQIEFRQVIPPQPGESWGGVLTVELRTLN